MREDVMDRELREIREARDVGYQALRSLRNAEELLESAGNWGIFDMIGGGMFSSMIKHSKIDKANAEMEQARYDLERAEGCLCEFQRGAEGGYQRISLDHRYVHGQHFFGLGGTEQDPGGAVKPEDFDSPGAGYFE